jgi:hypothetical protein
MELIFDPCWEKLLMAPAVGSARQAPKIRSVNKLTPIFNTNTHQLPGFKSLFISVSLYPAGM